MADYAVTGVAVCRALGLPDETFLDAYEANQMASSAVAFESQPVALAIQLLLSDGEPWRGTATELLPVLRGIAERNGIPFNQPGWPKDAGRLGAGLRRAIPGLRAIGIHVEIKRVGKGRSRIIWLEPDSSAK